MSTSRIESFSAHPETVYEALLDAAEALPARVHLMGNRQAVIARENKRYRLSASVTDNGTGQACVHLAWEPPSSSGGSKTAKKLLKKLSASLDEMAAGPPPAPPE